MKHSKKHSLSDRSVEKKLRAVQNTQEGIQSLTVWAIHHRDQAERLVTVWAKVFLESQAPHTITLMNVCNDIVQNCKRKNASVYKDMFKKHLPDALSHVSQDDSVIPTVERILKIWGERMIFDEDAISDFQESLISEEVKDKLQQEAMDKKLLSEFKPNKVVESLRGFRRLELDADFKYRQINSMRLDLTDSEAIKQLKDRDHGAEYSKQFDDHLKCLDEFSGDLEKVMQERAALIELLELTEHFYELQYGEALVVANAYKNFGIRVSRQENQLSQIAKAFPGSPRGSLASRVDGSFIGAGVMDMEMSDDERGEDEEPPIEPYSPDGMDSPQGPIGSPISPNTSMTDLDIVKGVAQPYDPLEAQLQYNPQSMMQNVYNPKMSLESNSNSDLSTRIQNLMPVPGSINSSNNDGDGTPTQDEFNDTRKRPSTEEYDPVPVKKSSTDSTITDEDWDLAWEVLEETFVSKAVSQSNLTTIQPTTDFTALTNNTTTTTTSKQSDLDFHRDLAASLGVITDQNGGQSLGNNSSNINIANSISSMVPRAGAVQRNNSSEALSEEDANARAQREFLERLTKRGPFKPSRYLQKLTEEKEKRPADAPTLSVVNTITSEEDCQFGQFDCQAPPPQIAVERPKVEYRIGGIARPAEQTPASAPPPVLTPQPALQSTPSPLLPVPQTLSFPPALKSENFNNDNLPVMSPPSSGPPPEFPAVDQDMRQFNPSRPPPPPPPVFINNQNPGPRTPTRFPAVGKPFVRTPPPPPPRPSPRIEFSQFQRPRGQNNNARMDSPRAWPPGLPRGPPPIPPPFFRPRF